jgi:hypothetical protein
MFYRLSLTYRCDAALAAVLDGRDDEAPMTFVLMASSLALSLAHADGADA